MGSASSSKKTVAIDEQSQSVNDKRIGIYVWYINEYNNIPLR